VSDRGRVAPGGARSTTCAATEIGDGAAPARIPLQAAYRTGLGAVNRFKALCNPSRLSNSWQTWTSRTTRVWPITQGGI
jgi:hypothetical protein